jgi:uncharacterized protein YdeI (YjbR/CyaY-like superfamily)
METEKDGVPAFYAGDRHEWRRWLEENHALVKKLWLIMYRKGSGTPSVHWSEAVDEALCFGWIDSKSIRRDAESSFLMFTRRNPKSKWSRINKEKVEKLLEAGRITPAGLAVIEAAKRNGAWNALDEVENLTLPPDLREALAASREAQVHFAAFPRSVKKVILEWILNAKRPETRQRRIRETVALAEKNIRANQYRP